MIRANDPLRIKSADVRQSEAQTLLKALTQELAVRYGDDGGENAFDPTDVETDRGAFLLAFWERKAIACGALRPIDDQIAEIKRMYVAPLYRGKGIARQLLLHLEELARNFAYDRVWLETGTEQPEAIRLYESCGYQPIPLYGYYKNDVRSRCFEKVLAE